MNIFNYLCPFGEMDAQTLVDLFNRARLLNKLKFSSSDVIKLFDGVLEAQNLIKKTGNSRANYLTFPMLMNGVIPLAAAKLGRDEDYIIFKLQRISVPMELQQLEVEQNRHDIQFLENVTQGNVTNDSEPVYTPEMIKAATSIQCMYRQTFAKLLRKVMKECEVQTNLISDSFSCIVLTLAQVLRHDFLDDDFPSNEDTEAVIVEVRLVFYSKNLARDMSLAGVIDLLQKMKFFDQTFTKSKLNTTKST